MPTWGAHSVLLHAQLILVASDLGQPVPYETMQPLQVALEDIDDNEPIFVRPPVSCPSLAPVVRTQGLTYLQALGLAGALCACGTHRWTHRNCMWSKEQILTKQLLFQGTTHPSKKQTGTPDSQSWQCS